MWGKETNWLWLGQSLAQCAHIEYANSNSNPIPIAISIPTSTSRLPLRATPTLIQFPIPFSHSHSHSQCLSSLPHLPLLSLAMFNPHFEERELILIRVAWHNFQVSREEAHPPYKGEEGTVRGTGSAQTWSFWRKKQNERRNKTKRTHN